MRGDREENVQVTGGSAAQARLSFTGKTDAGAVLDTARNGHGERALLAHTSRAVASAAGLIDHLAHTLTARAGAFDGEETLAGTNAPAAPAGTAGARAGAFRRAGASALPAGCKRGNADLRLLAGIGLLERNLEVVAQVGAASRLSRAAASAAHELSEHLVKDIGEAAAKTEFEAVRTSTAILEGGMAEAVVSRPLLLVLQDVIGFVDLFEFVLGRRIARIAVRVILHGQPAVGFLDVFDCCAARNAKRGVVVLLRHDKPWRTTPSLVGSSAWPAASRCYLLQ